MVVFIGVVKSFPSSDHHVLSVANHPFIPGGFRIPACIGFGTTSFTSNCIAAWFRAVPSSSAITINPSIMLVISLATFLEITRFFSGVINDCLSRSIHDFADKTWFRHVAIVSEGRVCRSKLNWGYPFSQPSKSHGKVLSPSLGLRPNFLT